MSETEDDILLPCSYTDGTDGFSCNFRGPYNFTRNKPSLAFIADEPIQLFQGEIKGRHLRCTPAIETYIELQRLDNEFIDQDTSEEKKEEYEKLVLRQRTCTHFRQPR